MAVETQELAVVVRYRHYDGATPAQCVDLMRWFTDLAEADAEAVRLNEVRRESVEYFVKILWNRPRRSSDLAPGSDSTSEAPLERTRWDGDSHDGEIQN